MTDIDFTILIPTRNRAALLERAIQSILQQGHDSYEILVINDGSEGEHYEAYRLVEQRHAGKTRFVHLDRVPTPHRSPTPNGKSRALNIGLTKARGEYIGFLDDDDYWIDADHLRNVKHATAATQGMADVFLSNQEASGGGVAHKRGWLSDLAPYLARTAQPCLPGMYIVTPKLLLQQAGFCHINTTIAKRKLILDMGGFDEYLPYEEDVDFYLRLIDKAQTILYCPNVTSHHTIPDASKHDNMSTRPSEVEKRLSQLTYLNKELLFAERRELRDYARLHKRYALKGLARILARKRDFVAAYHFALEGLFIGFTWKWLLYCMWLGIRAMTANRLHTATVAVPPMIPHDTCARK